MPSLLLVMIGGAAGAGLRRELGRFALSRLGTAALYVPASVSGSLLHLALGRWARAVS
ncbi:MAG TPA: hypothetical protein VF650_07010 [Allosphingosinicella sp.]|jgi:hypothetical protein